MVKRMEWQPAHTAPTGRKLLVAGNGSTRFALLDASGTWRKLHHRPMDNRPTHWMDPPRLCKECDGTGWSFTKAGRACGDCDGSGIA